MPLELLAPYPALHRCGRFDLTRILRKAHTIAMPFADRPAPHEPARQLDELLTRLRARGFAAYQRHLIRFPGPAAAVHVIVPGLERFFAVVKGALILPGPRGKAAVPGSH